MRSIAAILFGLILFPAASAQTFGLGEDTVVVVVGSPVAEVFGLEVVEVAPVAVTRSTTTKRTTTLPMRTRSVTTTKATTTAAYVSPPGVHRHVDIYGRVFEHSDANFGDPVAHANVARPWPKYYGPAAPGTVIATTRSVSSDCPGGVCPTNYSTTRTRTVSRRGWFRR